MSTSDKRYLTDWVIGTLIIFLVGWAVTCFVGWNWTLPLASTGSRLWLIVAMVFASKAAAE